MYWILTSNAKSEAVVWRWSLWAVLSVSPRGSCVWQWWLGRCAVWPCLQAKNVRKSKQEWYHMVCATDAQAHMHNVYRSSLHPIPLLWMSMDISEKKLGGWGGGRVWAYYFSRLGYTVYFYPPLWLSSTLHFLPQIPPQFHAVIFNFDNTTIKISRWLINATLFMLTPSLLWEPVWWPPLTSVPTAASQQPQDVGGAHACCSWSWAYQRWTSRRHQGRSPGGEGCLQAEGEPALKIALLFFSNLI